MQDFISEVDIIAADKAGTVTDTELVIVGIEEKTSLVCLPAI